MEQKERPKALAVVLAFATVYVVWGSTYLAIRFAITSVPPLTMAGIRFMVAGLILLGYCLVTRAPRPTAKQLRNAAIAGGLMLWLGNGSVCWAEQRVASGLVALVVATISLWLVVLNWAFGNRQRPTLSQACGVLIGLLGIFVLAFPSGRNLLGKGTDLVGTGVVILASLAWAAGTLYARYSELPASPWVMNGTEMAFGGLFALIAGFVRGERLVPSAVTSRSLFALAYLVVFGSIIAFSAYTWLIKNTTPARLGTYSYVNPAVAVLLGALLAGEPVNPRTLLAMALILAGVVMLSIVRNPAPALVHVKQQELADKILESV